MFFRSLTAADSGTSDAPIVYRGQPGKAVQIVGGKVVSGWRPVTDAKALAKLAPEVRRKVVQADLKAQGTRFLIAVPETHVIA